MRLGAQRCGLVRLFGNGFSGIWGGDGGADGFSGVSGGCCVVFRLMSVCLPLFGGEEMEELVLCFVLFSVCLPFFGDPSFSLTSPLSRIVHLVFPLSFVLSVLV